jgi:hypothetical protein
MTVPAAASETELETDPVTEPESESVSKEESSKEQKSDGILSSRFIMYALDKDQSVKDISELTEIGFGGT